MDELERFEDAKRLVNSESFLELTTTNKYVVLHPMFAGDLMGGIHDCLDKMKNLFSSRFGGVILSYGNIKHFGDQSAVDPSTGFSVHRINVDLIIFRPQIGSRVKAVVNKFGRDHIGCLVLNRFNASVSKDSNEARKLELGQEVSLVIKKVVFHRKILSLRGTFSDDETKGKKKKKEPSEDALDTPKTLKTPKEATPVGKKSKKRKRHQSSEEEEEEEEKSLRGTSSDDGTRRRKKKTEQSEDVLDTPKTLKTPMEETPLRKSSRIRKRHQSSENEDGEEGEEKTPKRHFVEGKSKRRSASNSGSRSPDSGGSGVASIDSDETAVPFVDSIPPTPSSSSPHKHKQKKPKHR